MLSITRNPSTTVFNLLERHQEILLATCIYLERLYRGKPANGIGNVNRGIERFSSVSSTKDSTLATIRKYR